MLTRKHAGFSWSKSCLVSVPTRMERVVLPSVMYVALALVKFRVVLDPSWSGAMMNRTKFHCSGENISVETHRWQRYSPD